MTVPRAHPWESSPPSMNCWRSETPSLRDSKSVRETNSALVPEHLFFRFIFNTWDRENEKTRGFLSVKVFNLNTPTTISVTPNPCTWHTVGTYFKWLNEQRLSKVTQPDHELPSWKDQAGGSFHNYTVNLHMTLYEARLFKYLMPIWVFKKEKPQKVFFSPLFLVNSNILHWLVHGNFPSAGPKLTHVAQAVFWNKPYMNPPHCHLVMQRKEKQS